MDKEEKLIRAVQRKMEIVARAEYDLAKAKWEQKKAERKLEELHYENLLT
jgi:hypothetical protein